MTTRSAGGDADDSAQRLVYQDWSMASTAPAHWSHVTSRLYNQQQQQQQPRAPVSAPCVARVMPALTLSDASTLARLRHQQQQQQPFATRAPAAASMTVPATSGVHAPVHITTDLLVALQSQLDTCADACRAGAPAERTYRYHGAFFANKNVMALASASRRCLALQPPPPACVFARECVPAPELSYDRSSAAQSSSSLRAGTAACAWFSG